MGFAFDPGAVDGAAAGGGGVAVGVAKVVVGAAVGESAKAVVGAMRPGVGSMVWFAPTPAAERAGRVLPDSPTAAATPVTRTTAPSRPSGRSLRTSMIFYPPRHFHY